MNLHEQDGAGPRPMEILLVDDNDRPPEILLITGSQEKASAAPDQAN